MATARPQEIRDDDTISRWIYAPIHIGVGDGIIKWPDTFQFQERNGLREESVNCHRFLESDSLLHAMGKAKEEGDNAQREAVGKDTLTYRGYIKANAGSIRQVAESDFRFTVYHKPEKGNPAHSHIRLELNKDTKSVKNHAKARLKDCFSDLVEAV